MSKGGSICAVYGCYNYKIQTEAKSFYRFPKNKEMCRQWIARIYRADLEDIFKEKGPEYLYKTYLVCSDHFTGKDFRNSNLPSQGIFPGAVPSLKLYSHVDNIRQSPKKRKREDSIELEPMEVSCEPRAEVRDAMMDIHTNIMCKSCPPMRRKLRNLQKLLHKYKRKCGIFKKKIVDLKAANGSKLVAINQEGGAALHYELP